jgi:hypothetical protein
VSFGVVGGESSRMVTTTSVAMVPVVSPLGAISALSLPPSFDVAPANVAVAADAGSIAGAVVADPMIEALDSCGNPAVVSFAITYPDNSTGSSWPAGGVFPIGVSTIAYTATDDVGQDTTASVTVTVANYQLLDVDVSLAGAITGNASRTIRVSAGSSVQVFEVPMTAGVGGIDGIQVPKGEAYAYVEGANGELGFYVVSNGTGKPWKLRVRPPCWPSSGHYSAPSSAAIAATSKSSTVSTAGGRLLVAASTRPCDTLSRPWRVNGGSRPTTSPSAYGATA